MEMGSNTLRSQNCKSNPWKGQSCGRGNCFPCKSDNGGDYRRPTWDTA